MSHNISLTIEEVCKKLGIDYKSPYITEYTKDAVRMSQIIRELKESLGDLQTIAEKHKIDGIGQMLLREISILDRCDHELIKLAHKIKEKEDAKI